MRQRTQGAEGVPPAGPCCTPPCWMVISALRYAIQSGDTLAIGEMSDWLAAHWDSLSGACRALVFLELEDTGDPALVKIRDSWEDRG